MDEGGLPYEPNNVENNTNNIENQPPAEQQMELNPELNNGVRPSLFVMLAMIYRLLPPGSFIFLDDDENIVTALLYCEMSRRYTCVIYQQNGRYTHFRHFPAHQEGQNG